MRTVRRVLFFACVAATLCVWSLPARAAENDTFGVTPQPETIDGVHRQSFEIPLETGATYQDAIRIYNRTDQPLDLTIYATDAQGGVDSSITVSARDTKPKGVGAWITLSRDKVSLAPHDEATITFRVKVRSADPQPNLGAIVVENGATGLSAGLATSSYIVVRTAPANTSTTSERLRPLLFRSPWAILAVVGLLLVLVLVIIGWRRRRRPKDALVAPGAVEESPERADTVTSLPVIRRLGAPPDESFEEDEDRPLLDDDLLVEIDDDYAFEDGDEDDIFEDEDEEDEDEEDASEISAELPPARPKTTTRTRKPAPPKTAQRTAGARKPAPRKIGTRKPAAKKKPATKRKAVVPRAQSTRDRNYIPLEDL